MTKNRFRFRFSLAAVLSFGISSLGLPAHAEAPQTVETCVAAALAEDLDNWVCMGGNLTEVPQSATDYSTPGPVPQTRAMGPMTLSLDDYDTWCEYGTICSRTLSDYIAEVKGNAAYGDQTGVIGSFDIVMRVNLNGRQPRWNVTLIHDTGPSLVFNRVLLACTQQYNIFGCGSFAADNGDAFIILGNGRFSGPMVYGNKLVDDGRYRTLLKATFQPLGYGTFPISDLLGHWFYCELNYCKIGY